MMNGIDRNERRCVRGFSIGLSGLALAAAVEAVAGDPPRKAATKPTATVAARAKPSAATRVESRQFKVHPVGSRTRPRRKITTVDIKMEPLRIETAFAAVTGEKKDIDKALADLEKARKDDPALTWPTLQAETVLFTELGDVERLEKTVERIYNFYVQHPESKPATDLLRRTVVFSPRPPEDADEKTQKAFKAVPGELLPRLIEKHPPAWTPFYFHLVEQYLGARKDTAAKAKLLKRLREQAAELTGKPGMTRADAFRELDYLDAVAETSGGSFRRFCELAENYLAKYGRDEHAGRLASMVVNGLTWRIRDHAHEDDLPPAGKRGRYWHALWKKTPVKHGKGCSKAREQSLELAWRRYRAVAKE